MAACDIDIVCYDMSVCRQEQTSESVDEVFCIKSEIVDSATNSQQEEDIPTTPCTELLEESESVTSLPQESAGELDTSVDDSYKVDTAAGIVSESMTQQDAETSEEKTDRSADVAPAADECDIGQPVSQSILQDSLSGAKRLPKAAANILRMPYDSIRRRDGDSLGSTSSDEVGDVAMESGGPGLMSRTLGSITALPSLFVKSSTDSATAAAAPSPTRSTPDKSDKSPGPHKPRTFFFHRLVSRSATNSSETEATDADRSADEGRYFHYWPSYRHINCFVHNYILLNKYYQSLFVVIT